MAHRRLDDHRQCRAGTRLNTGIRGASQSNLAYDALGGASSTQTGYPVSGANNGSITTPWATATGSAGGWWQTDLGSSYSLSDVQVLFRQDGQDNPAERANFQVWVSKYGDMSAGHTVACMVGALPLPYESRYDCTIPAGDWRYVAVVKTDASQFALGQVRVFGSANQTYAHHGRGGIGWDLPGIRHQHGWRGAARL